MRSLGRPIGRESPRSRLTRRPEASHSDRVFGSSRPQRALRRGDSEDVGVRDQRGALQGVQVEPLDVGTVAVHGPPEAAGAEGDEVDRVSRERRARDHAPGPGVERGQARAVVISGVDVVADHEHAVALGGDRQRASRRRRSARARGGGPGRPAARGPRSRRPTATRRRAPHRAAGRRGGRVAITFGSAGCGGGATVRQRQHDGDQHGGDRQRTGQRRPRPRPRAQRAAPRGRRGRAAARVPPPRRGPGAAR